MPRIVSVESRPGTARTVASAPSIAPNSAALNRSRPNRRDTRDRGGCVQRRTALRQIQLGLDSGRYSRFGRRIDHRGRELDHNRGAALRCDRAMRKPDLTAADSPKRIARRRAGIRVRMRGSPSGATAMRVVRSEDGGFLVRDFLDRAEALAMLDIDVEHQRGVGFEDRAEACDFAARVGAAFDHQRALIPGQREKRHRHADQVVQISRRRKYRAEQRAGQRRGYLLGGGLAGRTQNRDRRYRPDGALAFEVKAREIAERGERVGDLDRGNRRFAAPRAAPPPRRGASPPRQTRGRRGPRP